MQATLGRNEPADGSRHSASTAEHAAMADQIRHELGRILASETFRGAQSLRSFLQYVTEEVIAGRNTEIKEYTVGLEVFGRGGAFDPRKDSIVRTEARKLRSRLDKYYESEGADDPIRIEIPKGGYVPSFGENITPPRVERITPAASQVPGNSLSRMAWLGAAVLLVLVAAVGLLRYRSLEPQTLNSPSVAVLPFANLSDNKDDEIFIEGLTTQVTEALARVPGLRIVARSSADQYRSGTTDIRRIGRDLKVGTVVEGTVRRSGDRLRVTGELDDTVTGYRLWSASYDRNLNDILAVQREISDAIIRSVGLQLAGKGLLTDESAGGRTKVNPEGYQDYLEGRYFSHKNTPENIKTAIGYFERAIAKDPNYALAYTGLASCYSKLLGVTSATPLEVIPKIRMAAEKALKLDSALGEAHLNLALALMYDFDWTGAQKEFSRALELEPGSAVAHHAYGVYLARTGRLEEALAQHEISLDLDPIDPSSSEWVARSLYYLRRYDEAIGGFQNSLALNAGFGFARQGLGMAYLEKGDFTQGMRETILARQIMEGDPMTSGQLGFGYAMSRRPADAHRMLDELTQRSQGGTIPAYAVAQVYIGLGDKASAFKWLRTAIDQHDVNLFLLPDPLYDPLRSDPRFAELLEQMHLKAVR